MRVFEDGSDVFLGEVNTPIPDWREVGLEETEPDDELLRETPSDVIAILGFDPLEE